MPHSNLNLRRRFRLARRRRRSFAPEKTSSLQPREFAAPPLQIRRAIGPYRRWIESCLGVPLEQAVILCTPLEVSQLALLKCDPDPRLVERWPDELQRFAEAVEQVSHAPQGTQRLRLVERSSTTSSEDRRAQYDLHQSYELVWRDGPVALRLHGVASEVVAAGLIYRDAPYWNETIQDVLIFRRAELGPVTRLIASSAENELAACRHASDTVEEIEAFEWDWLTLAPEIRSTLKHDFNMFFEDREWYREMRIPHRRGYLLHGPPGNGKTSAVNAMLTSRGLTAYQMRLFDSDTGDSDLEAIFRKAAARGPAMILLEDIDRAFPRSGGSKCKISLQSLLNCLDGITTGTGIITVATANHPSLLDPAILRRPGRFDRVVLFANPSPELRQEYFANIHPAFAGADLSEAIYLADGFSFAQLRESYIVAAQMARGEGRQIVAADLTAGIRTLRGATHHALRKSDAAGFIGGSIEEIFA